MERMRERMLDGAFDEQLVRLYGESDVPRQRARYLAALDAFESVFGTRKDAAFLSAPGRSEIGGNHTDHQLGRVLAATVTLDMIAVAAPRSDMRVNIHSEGYRPMRLSLEKSEPLAHEKGTSMALVRGVASKLRSGGRTVRGFDAFVSSGVPRGSGLSSSAAYSILICTILSNLYNGGRIPPTEQALASKYAENVHFGKPSGLLDQLACAVGGFVYIDFADADQPKVERVPCDLASLGYDICIVNAGGSHAGLTNEYAAVPGEMRAVAEAFGEAYLSRVDENAFYARLGELREKTGDRALLRAMHFFGENARVPREVEALKARDIEGFRRLMIQSGRSSLELLQNVSPSSPHERSVALALALSERFLSQKGGAWRVHGGGFAGTIQALVPKGLVDAYLNEMERVFGAGCGYVLAVRPVGGVMLS